MFNNLPEPDQRFKASSPDLITTAGNQLPDGSVKQNQLADGSVLPHYAETGESIDGEPVYTFVGNATMPQAQMHIIESPKVQCVLYLTNDVLRIDCTRSLPNIWIRFWHKLLLGWRWEKL